jgi:hypothetical protein
MFATRMPMIMNPNLHVQPNLLRKGQPPQRLRLASQ